MLKCWSHLPEDRPSFKELSKCLWDLEHGENTYVNVEGLMRQSVDNQGTRVVSIVKIVVYQRTDTTYLVLINAYTPKQDTVPCIIFHVNYNHYMY